MKMHVLAYFLAIKFCSLQAQTIAPVSQEHTQLNKPLVHLLDSLITGDQKWRTFRRQHNNHELDIKADTLTDDQIARNMTMADSMEYDAVKAIFEQYGFVNYDLAGKDGSINFWALVQHQDKHPAFQDCVLEQMKKEVDAQKAPTDNYAYLVDRVKINYGSPQVYGTQIIYNEDSTAYIPSPIADPEHVNERRKSVGLGTIEDYTAYFTKRFW